MNIILLGDSIRMGYQLLVTELLRDSATIWCPAENCEDSRKTRTKLPEWLSGHDPDLIHFNCGLHDLKLLDGTYQVPIDQYVANLSSIVETMRSLTRARLIWATITPVDDPRHRNRGVPFTRVNADVIRYNDAALKRMHELSIEINDLYRLLMSHDAAGLGPDGIHMNPQGNRDLAQAVASLLKT